MKKRGYYDVVCLFSDGWVRVTSNPKRSLSAEEVVKDLRKYLAAFEKGIAAQRQNNKRLQRAVVKTK